MALAIRQWFAIVPKFGGFISLIASSLVIRDLIARTRHHRVIPLRSAITLGKCVSCCMFSLFGPFMSTWMAPTGDAFYALGNTMSCTIQGFLVTFSIVSFVAYFIALVAVHGLETRRILTETELNQKTIRCLALLLPVTLAVIAAAAPLFDDAYNFSGIYSCSIAPHPLGCSQELGIPCSRGTHARSLVGGVTFTFNAVAYFFAFLGYYTEDKPGHRELFYSWPGAMMNFTISFSCLIVFFLVLKYGTIEAKMSAFYLNVAVTPLTGLFMSLIYFYAPGKASRVSEVDQEEEETIALGLSKPLLKRIPRAKDDEESPFV